jgi:hypothetical protein
VAEPTEAEIPAAGQVCQSALEATVGAEIPAAPLLILFNRAGEDRWVIKYHNLLPEVTSADLLEIAALVCIDEWVETVGCYTSTWQATQCGVLDPLAYKRHWNVRIARWPDGQVIAETALTGGDPPTSTLGGAGYGDPPLDEFEGWLMAHLNEGTSVPPQATLAATPTRPPKATATRLPTATRTRTPTPQPSVTPTPQTQAGAAPVIESVTLRNSTSSGGLVIFQDIRFHDPDGDAYRVDYQLVHTTAPSVEVRGGAIDASSRQQKLGATLTGKWTCGKGQYEVTLRVTIQDKAGYKSNPVDYTMECR